MRADRVITRVVGWAASVFQHIERRGGPVPDGPILIVANHLNALLDPLVLFRVAGRPSRPLAKAPLFDQVFVGGVLRGLGGLPVYRRQDDPGEMHRNQDTFRAAIDALGRGDALQIFPEGRSHSEPALEPLRTGAARIALGAEAEAEAEGRPGLRIVPVGLTYDGKERFRGRVLAEIGEPFEVAPWLTPGGAADPDAVGALTDEIGRRLRHVTLNLTKATDRTLVEAADRIYTREKALHGFRERDPLTERVPRLRRFAEAMAWLRVHDPTRFQRLAGRVRRHQRLATALGAEEGDVPDRYRTRDVLRYVVREGGPLLVAAPLALVGTAIWYPTWIAPRFVLRVVRPDRESIATYKLATGFAAVPLTVLTATAVAGWLGGWIAAALAFVAVPLIGLFTLLWRERWLRVREDARLFLRVLGRSGLRERIAIRRAALVSEFDEILAEMDSTTVGS